MKKEDNDWKIGRDMIRRDKCDAEYDRLVRINGESYWVPSSVACLSHAILLLVDATNDK
jgi:O-phosphoseryl-tRNA(Cys) synthetase